MKTFHHGGRIGDLIYSLYAMKKLGGGQITLTPRQKGNWDIDIANSMKSFLYTQDFIKLAFTCELDDDDYDEYGKTFDYDLVDAERSYNPELFPEWHGKVWPGNIHIAKRYAVQFGIEFVPNEPWIKPKKCKKKKQIVVHAPERRCTDKEQLKELIRRLPEDYNLIAIGSNGDADWLDMRTEYPNEYKRVWELLSESVCMIGAVSSVHALAEAMGLPRYVQVAPGCDNVIPTLNINDMKVEDICRCLK